MARRTVVQLTDDLDGKPIPDGKGETVRFSLDRQDYEIDLGEKNAKALRDALSSYVASARRAGGAPRGRRPPRPGSTTRRRSARGLNPRASRSASADACRPSSSPGSRKPTPEPAGVRCVDRARVMAVGAAVQAGRVHRPRPTSLRLIGRLPLAR